MNKDQAYYPATAVSELNVQSRATFISRTYAHLFAAILGFTLIEVYFFKTGLAETIARSLLGISWLFVMGGFMVVSWRPAASP